MVSFQIFKRALIIEPFVKSLIWTFECLFEPQSF